MQQIFQPSDKAILLSIKKKFLEYTKNNSDFRTISFTELYKLLAPKERAIIKKLRTINPKRYGFKGEYFGIGRVPKDLVRCANVTDGTNHYLPRKVYASFLGMNVALYQATGKRLLIDSGYRSPAYQALVFLGYLFENEMELEKTCARVALPGWSEHGEPKQQAIDFEIEHRPKGVKFERTPEYKWLLMNAAKYGFHLSYPKNNKLGVMFEPWHWAYHG